MKSPFSNTYNSIFVIFIICFILRNRRNDNISRIFGSSRIGAFGNFTRVFFL